MKNRAKCKLCQSVIESFHETDYVTCKCSHISVSGGPKMECSSLDWDNFLRVDDEGNEVIVKVIEKNGDVKPLYKKENPHVKPNKEELLNILDLMIKSFESLPQHALEAPVTNYDLISALLLISSIFRS